MQDAADLVWRQKMAAALAEEPGPAFAEAVDLVTQHPAAIGDRADRGVQAGTVAGAANRVRRMLRRSLSPLRRRRASWAWRYRRSSAPGGGSGDWRRVRSQWATEGYRVSSNTLAGWPGSMLRHSPMMRQTLDS